MSPVWVVPFLVLLFGGTALVALLRVTADSARELRHEVARFGELHVALARLRDESHRTVQAVADLRER